MASAIPRATTARIPAGPHVAPALTPLAMPASARLRRAMETMDVLAALTMRDHGARLHSAACAQHLPDLRSALAHLPPGQAGVRIHGIAALRPFLATDGPIGAIAAATLGNDCRAVRAVLFDKSARNNWSLAWHQDRTICVRQRREVDGFGPWTMKAGLQHVAPPFGLLARMVTLRVHFDDVPPDNAPLLIAPGSHARGRVAVTEIEDVVRSCGTLACLAAGGDVWAYATPILHASDAATRPAHRRVLQVDFSADDLPGGLEWLGV